MPRSEARASCARAPSPHSSSAIRAHAPVLRALGDEARLEIVARLAAAGGTVCVCDLTPGLGLSQPTISHHLRVLRDAGIVRSERRGSWVHYSLELSVLGVLGELIAALAPPRAALDASSEPRTVALAAKEG